MVTIRRKPLRQRMVATALRAMGKDPGVIPRKTLAKKMLTASSIKFMEMMRKKINSRVEMVMKERLGWSKKGGENELLNQLDRNEYRTTVQGKVVSEFAIRIGLFRIGVPQKKIDSIFKKLYSNQKKFSMGSHMDYFEYMPLTTPDPSGERDLYNEALTKIKWLKDNLPPGYSAKKFWRYYHEFRLKFG